MLLLLTIGLVLVATVALVIGFVTSALAPIYVSIACSVAAALVLFFFSRLSKREVPATAGGPAPLPGPIVTSDAPAGSTVTVLGSTPPAPPAAEPATEQVPALGPEEEAALLEAEAEAEERAARESVPADEAFAPEGLIAPAEPAGAEAVQAEVDEWQPAPTAADELEEEGAEEAEAEEPAAFEEPEPEEAWPSAAGEGEAEAAEEAEEAEGGEELIFPIADYDDLRVSEILPLLPELDEDELQLVRDREQQGRARFSILTRLDQLMSQLGGAGAVAAAAPSQGFEEDVTGIGVPSTVEGAGERIEEVPSYPPPAPPEPPAAEPVGVPYGEGARAIEAAEGPEPGIEQPETAAEAVPAFAATEREPAPEPEVAEAAAAAEPVERAFPIADYDTKKVTEILPLLTNMGADDLARVAAYEQRGKARGSVLSRIEQLQARASETAPPPTTVKKVTARKAPAKRATEPAKKAAEPAKKTAAAKRAETAKKVAAAKAAEAQKATRAAKAPSKATKASKAGKEADEAPADKAPAEKAPAKNAPSRTTKKQ